MNFFWGRLDDDEITRTNWLMVRILSRNGQVHPGVRYLRFNEGKTEKDPGRTGITERSRSCISGHQNNRFRI